MKLIQGLIIIVFLICLDQGSKIWVDRYIPLNDTYDVLSNFIGIAHVKNSGVSFGFLSNLPNIIRLPLLIGISSISSIGILYFLIKKWRDMKRYMKIALILILSGAVGNLIDRVIYGAVTDFIEFRWFGNTLFSNNLADCFISIGVLFLLLDSLMGEHSAS